MNLDLDKYGDCEVITHELIKEAVQSHKDIFQAVGDMCRMAFEGAFRDDCSLTDMGLIVMAVGMSAYQHGKRNEGKTEHAPGPKMNLDLTALDKLKR